MIESKKYANKVSSQELKDLHGESYMGNPIISEICRHLYIIFNHLLLVQFVYFFMLPSLLFKMTAISILGHELRGLLLQVGVCFLVDCTGSMGQWIKEIKKKIKSWSELLHANYTHLELHLAFVRYTDYDQPLTSRTTTLEFTT